MPSLARKSSSYRAALLRLPDISKLSSLLLTPSSTRDPNAPPSILGGSPVRRSCGEFVDGKPISNPNSRQPALTRPVSLLRKLLSGGSRQSQSAGGADDAANHCAGSTPEVASEFDKKYLRCSTRPLGKGSTAL
eukprot:scaffold19818_cov32-Prasinocladus_malaysianus.AAC.1